MHVTNPTIIELKQYIVSLTRPSNGSESAPCRGWPGYISARNFWEQRFSLIRRRFFQRHEEEKWRLSHGVWFCAKGSDLASTPD